MRVGKDPRPVVEAYGFITSPREGRALIDTACCQCGKNIPANASRLKISIIGGAFVCDVKTKDYFHKPWATTIIDLCSEDCSSKFMAANSDRDTFRDPVIPMFGPDDTVYTVTKGKMTACKGSEYLDK